MSRPSASAIHYCQLACPLGDLLIGGSEGRLEFLCLPDSDRPRGIEGEWIEDAASFAGVCEELEAYFAGTLTEFRSVYSLHGTDFQRSVWERLAAIPFGQVKSYGDIAHELGNPGASRAVGLANNANPLPIIVPCHRVIGANGALVGFGGGMNAKIWLLEHEGIHPSQIRSPDQMGFGF